MAAFITAQAAADHLQLTTDDMADAQVAANVAAYSDAAEGACLNYIKHDAAWLMAQGDSAVLSFTQAAKLVLGWFWASRESARSDSSNSAIQQQEFAGLPDGLPGGAAALLWRLRDPALR